MGTVGDGIARQRSANRKMIRMNDQYNKLLPVPVHKWGAMLRSSTGLSIGGGLLRLELQQCGE